MIEDEPQCICEREIEIAAMKRWNINAGKFNQWETLGQDEKDELITQEKKIDRAYSEGAEAAYYGKADRDANPYTENSLLHLHWGWGWQNVEDESWDIHRCPFEIPDTKLMEEKIHKEMDGTES